MKKIFFLVGLPRAGNTLLSAILNQNPKIAVTANSVTPDLLYNISQIKNSIIFQNFPDHESFNNIAHHVFDLYYKNWKQTYIIDRSPWGTPGNLKILREIKKNIKIIVLTRDLIEVLASFIRWSRANPNNFQDKFKPKTIEEQCDNLIQGDVLSQNLWAVKHLLLREDKSLYHLVKYKELVQNPDLIIKGIYKYLDIPPFQHHYTNLDQFEVNGLRYDDRVIGKRLHSIRTDRICPSEEDAYRLIPESIIWEHRKEWLL